MTKEGGIMAKAFRKSNKKLYRFIASQMGIDLGTGSLSSQLKKRNKDDPRDPMLEKLLQQLFAAYDADNSGQLDKTEIKKLVQDTCTEMGIPQAEEEEIDEMIKLFDDTGDGLFDFDETYDMIAPFIA